MTGTGVTGDGTTGTGVPLLSARGLTKRFGGVTALDNVSLDLYPGEVLALTGDNGAGKSTLTKCLSGVHKPKTGQLLFGGREVQL
ncbi:MAG: ATP-binding cassette domain-containing protein, partial [Deinococcus sp.]